MKTPKSPVAQVIKPLPKPDDEAMKKQKKNQLRMLQSRTGRESTIFTQASKAPLAQQVSQKLGG